MGLGGQRERVENTPSKLASPPSTINANHCDENLADALAEAQRRVVEQRMAAEALLLEARALEEQLLTEASAAHAARQRARETAALASQAAAAEEDARKRALAAAEQYTVNRLASESATAQIVELKRRLEEALRVAADSAAMAIAAKQEEADAAARVAECQAAREAAEREAQAARIEAKAFGNGSPNAALSAAGIEEVRALTARIAELKRTSSVPS